MNKDIIQGNWMELKGKVKQQWGKLTDDEIAQMNGSYEELQGVLEKSYGYQTDRAKKEINEFLAHHGYKDKANS